MASLYRERTSGRWAIMYVDVEGKRRKLRLPRSTKKRVAEDTYAHLAGLEVKVKHGLLDTEELKYRQYEAAPLSEHIDAYEDYLTAKGDSTKHIDSTLSYLNAVLQDECAFGTLGAIDAMRVAEHLAKLKRNGKGERARAARTIAVKAFSRWAWKTGRCRSDKLATLTVPRGTRAKKHPRRALEPEEAQRLIDAAQDGPDFRGVDGPTRALVYHLALGTGLRANEIRSLTPESFHLGEGPLVTVRSEYSKRRREDTLPLKRSLADRLKTHLAQCTPGAPVFPLPEKTAQMVKADLDQARAAWIEEAKTDKERERREKSGFLQYKDRAGRYADFHALRHTFISGLARAGVPPRTAQALARHSDVNLTMAVYSHVRVYDERRAVEDLPEFNAANTGKDGDHHAASA